MPEALQSAPVTPHAEGRYGGATAWRRYGRGSPVVLIHGVGMSQSVWAPQLSAFLGRYEVITYDLLGHGDSAMPPSGAVLADYSAQLLVLVDALDVERPCIVGHSMGALVSLDFALRHPQRCRAVAALNAVFCRSPEQRRAVMKRAQALREAGGTGNLDETLRRWFGEPVPQHLRAAAEQVRRMLEEVDAEGYARTYAVFASADAAHAEQLPKLACPALFATGDGDPNSTPDMSRNMAGLVPGARQVVLEGARHMMTVTDPERVNAMLLDFLAGAIL